MQPTFYKKLIEREQKGSLRSLLSFEGDMIDFWSNDYLGLGQRKNLLNVQSGSGSRLISGNSRNIEAVESFIASHFYGEAALIFNSGYDANLGFFGAVPQKGDTILYDELIHASVRDGMRLSFAKAFSFAHNDLTALEQRLKKSEGTIFVAIESIYSMDGDLAPLKEIAELCKQYGALLIVDEAHAGGVFGTNGTGLCEEAGIVPAVFARLITFGKGFGAHGAAILGSYELQSFLVNFARPFIYTTALPESMYDHIAYQVRCAMDEAPRLALQTNIALFQEKIGNLHSDARSPIQIVAYNDMQKCMLKASELQKKGIAVKAILPPTVPEGKSYLRVCLHAYNTAAEIQQLTEILNA